MYEFKYVLHCKKGTEKKLVQGDKLSVSKKD